MWKNHFGWKEEDFIQGKKNTFLLQWSTTNKKGGSGSSGVQSPPVSHLLPPLPCFWGNRVPCSCANSIAGTARGLLMWKPSPNNNSFHRGAQAAIWRWQCWVTADLVFSVSWYRLELCQFAPVESLALNGGDYPGFYSSTEKVAAAVLRIQDFNLGETESSGVVSRGACGKNLSPSSASILFPPFYFIWRDIAQAHHEMKAIKL